MRAAALAVLFALSACGPKEVDLAVNVISQSCDVDLDPFSGVNVIEVRITGPGIETPLVTRVQRTEGRVQIPQIPAGPARVIEIRGLAESSSQRPLSIGRTLPFEIPDVLADSTRRLDLNVFLRRIDSFTPPNSAAAPTSCSNMRSLRAGHTATLLKDGRVFIAGGFRLEGSNRIALADTEFYNPATGSFDQGPDLATLGGTKLPKAFHTATLLRNGQVMLYGGERYTAGTANPAPSSTVLIFDVDQGAFGAVPARNNPINISRTRHIAIPEASGRVLIVGGMRTNAQMQLIAVNELEWFDPTTNQVNVVSGEMLPRIEPSGAAVQDGGVIVVAGGVDGNGMLSDEVNFFRFDGAIGDGGQFVRAGSTLHMPLGRRAGSAMTLADDRTVLVMGGYRDATQLTTDPSSVAIKTTNNTVEAASATIGDRGDACTALTQQGNVIAVGGRKATGATDNAATLIRFDVDKGTLTAAAASPIKKSLYLHTCTTLADGTVLVTGGISDANGSMPTMLRDAWIYTPIPNE